MAALPIITLADLPRVCPACGNKYMRYERMPQRKAGVIKFVGILISMAWLVACFFIVFTTVELSKTGLVVIFASAAVPGVFMGIYAQSLKQLMRTKCNKCGLEESFLFDRSYSRPVKS
ncbi:MAG: hypothetical protein KDA41_07760 [Planctomycetales bacterium]|nr:hypothetical protein [Planctomycetales bacterium]